MLKRLTLPLGLALVMLAGAALAADPTAGQIYQAAQSGNIAQAQQMIQQVLRDHPNSAKAHFIAAEVDARAQNLGEARQELAKAEALRPGLPFASPHAVRQLRAQLGQSPGHGVGRRSIRSSSHKSWAPFLLLIGGIIVVWMIVRRRMAMAHYNAFPGQMPGGMPPGGPMGTPPGYGPGGSPPAGYGPGYGSGPGIMGSLGTGLAVGAGMAAGEELVGHMLNPGGGVAGGLGGGMIPDANAGQLDPQVNSDMGGNDFGVSDPGSWDDGSGGGGGWDSGGGDGGWT